MLAVSAATVGTLVTIAYGVGRGLDPKLRFLDPRRPPTTEEAIAVIPIEYALRSREANDVIFIGDSACHGGVDPIALERATGFRAWNFGSIFSIGSQGLLVTLKAYLAHHPLPRLVVLCASPYCFELPSASGGELSQHFVANYGPEVSGVVSLRETICYFAKQGAVSALLDSSREDTFHAPLRGAAGETYLTLQQETERSRGFFYPRGRRGVAVVARPNPPDVIQSEWDLGVRKISRECVAWGIPLLIVCAPVERDDTEGRDFAPLEKWLRDIESQCPGVTVARPALIVYESPLMSDSIHLNARGVEKFMPVVAKDVQALLDP